MPRRSILSAAERDSLLALHDTQDELIRNYTFSEPDLCRGAVVLTALPRSGPATRRGSANAPAAMDRTA